MTQKRRERPIQKLSTRYGSLTVGGRLTLLLTGSLTVATAIFLCMMGPLAKPDFWQPVQLVDLVANLIMFSTASLVVLSPIGYSWHFFLSSVDAAVSLTIRQLNYPLLPYLANLITHLQAAFTRHLPAQRLLSACVTSQTRAIQAQLHEQLPQLRTKSKAPMLLFQQASLLSAP
ncbi:MAG: hypothetical protein ACE5EY_03575 [Anaerolineae bacterium]